MAPLTQKEVLKRLTVVYREISVLQMDVKTICEEAAEVLPEADLPSLKKLAQLLAKDKVGFEVEKLKSFLELADELA